MNPEKYLLEKREVLKKKRLVGNHLMEPTRRIARLE